MSAPDRHSIREIAATDAGRASAILIEAADWSQSIGVPLWADSEVSIAQCEAWARERVLFAGFDADAMSAVFCLHDDDALYWPEAAAGSALYLHKVAVRRASAGAGWLDRIVSWALDESRRRSAPKLRLDTLAKSRLVSLYESRHFVLVDADPIAIGGREIVRMERDVPAH
jgi:GNAT superfamily N-acetyltransferase